MWCESNFPCYGINSVLFNHMNNMPENKIQPSVIFYFVHLALETRLEGDGKEKLKTQQSHSCHKLMAPFVFRHFFGKRKVSHSTYIKRCKQKEIPVILRYQIIFNS